MPKNYLYTQHTSIVYFSLYLYSLVSQYLARDLARACIIGQPVTENPSKIQKIIKENLSKSKLCVPVRKSPLPSPPKTKITRATLNFG